MSFFCHPGLGSSFILYLAVAITNYMALGNLVPDDALLGYEQSPTWISILANVMVALHMVASARVRSTGHMLSGLAPHIDLPSQCD